MPLEVLGPVILVLSIYPPCDLARWVDLVSLRLEVVNLGYAAALRDLGRGSDLYARG